MSAPKLTEATIRRLASDRSFSRGEEYYNSGAVSDLVRRGNSLQAQVEGSQYEPYNVAVELDAGGVAWASCTCPYEFGGYCKHIVAVLLTYIREPDRVIERRQASELLAGLRQDELLELLTRLLSEHPRLIDWIEMQLAARAAVPSPDAAAGPRQRHALIDPSSFRRQAQSVMTDSSRDYWAGNSVVDEMRKLADQARPFIEAGDGRNALLILEAITSTYIDYWTEFDDSDGDLSDFFEELGKLFAEAILSADLSPEERKEWVERLWAWQEELKDYGPDREFCVAVTAAEQGWDYPPLQRVMQGHIGERIWEEEVPPWYACGLTELRLDVLERQGKVNEYLNLARAEHQTVKYATMLVKLGRSREAMEYALEHLVVSDQALALAKFLREHNLPIDALRIAEYGLMLGGVKNNLARWLRDFAVEMGRTDLALEAARAAFADNTSLEDYLAVQAIAEEEWPAIKPELLELIAASRHHGSGKVDIYLHEGMIDEAIKEADRSYTSYIAVERVIDAVWQTHPDWVIQQCRRHAESIMDEGKSKYYHRAVHWLEKARRSYLASGRADEWSKYLEGLIAQHARKRALRSALEGLRR